MPSSPLRFQAESPNPGHSGSDVTVTPHNEWEHIMGLLLWIAAVILVIAGIVTLIGGSVLWGIVLIVVGLAVGPGGWSIFNRGGSRT